MKTCKLYDVVQSFIPLVECQEWAILCYKEQWNDILWKPHAHIIHIFLDNFAILFATDMWSVCCKDVNVVKTRTQSFRNILFISAATRSCPTNVKWLSFVWHVTCQGYVLRSLFTWVHKDRRNPFISKPTAVLSSSMRVEPNGWIHIECDSHLKTTAEAIEKWISRHCKIRAQHYYQFVFTLKLLHMNRI